MTVQRLEHIGIVVDDLAAATAFFAALGLELQGEASVEGGLVDRINGLEGVRADMGRAGTRDGTGARAEAGREGGGEARDGDPERRPAGGGRVGGAGREAVK